MADPLSIGLALSPLLGLLGGGGGGEAPEMDPRLRAMLEQQHQMSLRNQFLVDPKAASLLGTGGQDLSGAVPLREAVNQLAFALLPNFVRPADSLFPGIGPGFGPNPNAATPANRPGGAGNQPFFDNLQAGAQGQDDLLAFIRSQFPNAPDVSQIPGAVDTGRQAKPRPGGRFDFGDEGPPKQGASAGEVLGNAGEQFSPSPPQNVSLDEILAALAELSQRA